MYPPMPDRLLRSTTLVLTLLPILLSSLVACSRPTPDVPVGETDGDSLPATATPSPFAAGAQGSEGSGEGQDVEEGFSLDATPTELPPDVATARAGDRPAAGSDSESSEGDEVGEATEAGDESEAEAGTGSPDASPILAGGDGLAICRDLREQAADVLGVVPEALSLRAADVQDPIDLAILDGCQLSIQAPGAELAIGEGATTLPGYRLRELLLASGWRAELAHSILQPGRSLDVFTRSEAVCLTEVRFEPPAGRPCPEVSDPTCGLAPGQLDYSISLSCARY